MKILILIQRNYGERIAQQVKARKLPEWSVDVVKLPSIEYSKALDSPEEALEEISFSNCDLLLSLGEQPSVPLLIPAIVTRTGAKAVIIAVDNPDWVPGRGLEEQLINELKEKNTSCYFAKPLCSLKPQNDPFIKEFTKIFGLPILQITVKDRLIEDVKVRRGSPCGSTWFVAHKLSGIPVSQAKYDAAIQLSNYPCLASTKIDHSLKDSIMHMACHILQKEIERAVLTTD